MNTEFRTFLKLSSTQVYDVLRLRQQVFMLEQNCLYEDADGFDKYALHLLLYDNKKLAGCLRIFEPGIKFEETTLGRIVIDKKYRGKNVGPQLIKRGVELAFQQFPGFNIRIEAQALLTSYYNKYGFIEEGEIYEVDEIKHIQMVLQKPT
ncbi:MAG: GNAT family N-acetyltransferase [Balneolaceae bacterium]